MSPSFDDIADKLNQKLKTLKSILSGLEDVVNTYKLSLIPRAELREIEGLTKNLRNTKSNMVATYIELRKEEGT